MREIKFRAWDSSKDRWVIQSDYIHVDLDGSITYCDDDGSETNRNDLTLMQYTGLKDKNGVEIYEGDILRYGASKSSGTIADVYIKDIVVEWQSDKAGFNLNADSVADMYEVIGNIHKNPELLK